MIEILWKNIKHDVDKETYRVANVRLQDPELKAGAQEDSTKSSLLFVLRLAEEANASARAIAGPVFKANTETKQANDGIEHREDYAWTYELERDADIDERSLALLLHRYVVRYILREWSLVWATDSYAAFDRLLADASVELTDMAYGHALPKKKRRAMQKTDECSVTLSDCECLTYIIHGFNTEFSEDSENKGEADVL